MKPIALLFLLMLCHSTPLVASEVGEESQRLELSADDINRLGISFAPVTFAGLDAGPRVPAEVINSPEKSSSVIAPYEGIVERWLVNMGQPVLEGQTLASVFSQPVAERQQAWITARNQSAQANENAEKDRQLFDQGVIAAKRLAQTLRAQDQARFDLSAATSELARAGIHGDDLNKLLSGELRPGTYFLTAPSDGVLADRRVDAGDHLEVQSTAAMVRQDGALWLRAQVPAALARLLQPGQPLTLEDSDETLTLRQRSAMVARASQTVEILASFDGPSDFYPGQIVSLILPRTEGGRQMPASALIHQGGDSLVFVRVPGGVEIRKVKAVAAGRHYLALDGVAEGEDIAVTGASLLKGMMLGLGGDE
jgi:RND family efflux transporter MFP subunit